MRTSFLDVRACNDLYLLNWLAGSSAGWSYYATTWSFRFRISETTRQWYGCRWSLQTSYNGWSCISVLRYRWKVTVVEITLTSGSERWVSFHAVSSSLSSLLDCLNDASSQACYTITETSSFASLILLLLHAVVRYLNALLLCPGGNFTALLPVFLCFSNIIVPARSP